VRPATAARAPAAHGTAEAVRLEQVPAGRISQPKGGVTKRKNVTANAHGAVNLCEWRHMFSRRSCLQAYRLLVRPGGIDPEFDMRDNPISEVISRRHALSLIGRAAVVAVAGPAAVLTTADAQTQQPAGGQSPAQAAPGGQSRPQTTGQGAPQTAGTPQTGTERRQARRTSRVQRRTARRNARRQAREARRALRRGQSVGAGGASTPSSTPSSSY
jgi:hypothetical protein